MVWDFLMWNAAQIHKLRAENPEILCSKPPFPTALFLGALYQETLAGSLNPQRCLRITQGQHVVVSERKDSSDLGPD